MTTELTITIQQSSNRYVWIALFADGAEYSCIANNQTFASLSECWDDLELFMTESGKTDGLR